MSTPTVLPTISAVIPNRDGADLLRRTLPPLLRELAAGEDEVLVVDDASADDSVAVLAREFPQVRVISLERNVGFGAACNRGFQEATHDLVLLLNSDMEVTPGSVSCLAEHFSDPQVFAVGPQYVSDDSAAAPPPALESVSRQLGAPAGGGLFRCEVFLQLGGFDALYRPFYWEDLDLGWNAWREGWTILHDPRSRFVHLESATIRRLYSAAFVKRIRARNRCLFAWKNLRNPGLRARFLGRTALRALGELVRSGDASVLLGAATSVPLIPRALAARRPAGLGDAAILSAASTPFSQLNGV